MTDRELIEWVANATVGEKLPDEFLQPGLPHERAATAGVIAQLARAGVMDPLLGERLDIAAERAQAACRAWLAEHPA